LNDPVTCRHSSFSQSSACGTIGVRASVAWNMGVTRTPPAMRLRAARTSSRVIMGVLEA
jgi:hypothetical protein